MFTIRNYLLRISGRSQVKSVNFGMITAFTSHWATLHHPVIDYFPYPAYPVMFYCIFKAYINKCLVAKQQLCKSTVIIILSKKIVVYDNG